MGRIVDISRGIDLKLSKISSLLDTFNMSIGFTVIDGESLPTAKPVDPQPDGLSVLGGIYDPLSRSFIDTVSEPYIKLLASPEQAKVLMDTSKNLCVVGGQRSGKTQIGFYKACIELITKANKIVFYIVPSYSKEDIITKLIDSTLSTWIVGKWRKEHRWKLCNGSEIRIFSVAGSGSTGRSVQAFLGYEADRIILEEFREFSNSQKTFHDALSRVITRNGGITIVSSPEPGHTLEDIAFGKFESDEYPDINFSVHHLSTFNSVFARRDATNPTYAFDVAKNFYPKNRYRRDVLGEFVSADDVDYYEFDTQRHIVSSMVGQDATSLLWQTREVWGKTNPSVLQPGFVWEPNLNQKFDYIVGMDPGNTVCSATIMKASIDTDGFITPGDLNFMNLRLTVLSEFQRENTNLIEFTTILKDHVLNGIHPSRVCVFADPAIINEKSLIDSVNGYTVLKQLGFTVFVKRGYDKREDAKDCVNTRFKMNMLHIHKSCKKTIESLVKVTSDGKSMTNISRDPYGHLPDSIKYVVSYLFPWWRIVHETNTNQELRKLYSKNHMV